VTSQRTQENVDTDGVTDNAARKMIGSQLRSSARCVRRRLCRHLLRRFFLKDRDGRQRKKRTFVKTQNGE